MRRLFSILYFFLVIDIEAMEFPFAVFSHLDRDNRTREAAVYADLTRENVYQKLLTHMSVSGEFADLSSRESKLFNAAFQRILDNPIGLELAKMLVTKLERKKIIWELILAKAQEIKNQSAAVQVAIPNCSSAVPATKTTAEALVKSEFYKAKNFMRLLLRPDGPADYTTGDINTFIANTTNTALFNRLEIMRA